MSRLMTLMLWWKKSPNTHEWYVQQKLLNCYCHCGAFFLFFVCLLCAKICHSLYSGRVCNTVVVLNAPTIDHTLYWISAIAISSLIEILFLAADSDWKLFDVGFGQSVIESPCRDNCLLPKYQSKTRCVNHAQFKYNRYNHNAQCTLQIVWISLVNGK